MLECSLSADIHAVASRCRVDARSGRCVGSSLTMALCPASAVMGCKAGEQRGCQRRGRRGRWLRSSLRGPLRDSAPLCCHDSARSAPRRVTRPRRPPRISRAAASHAEISGHRERVVQNVTAIRAICAALRDSAPLCSPLLDSADSARSAPTLLDSARRAAIAERWVPRRVSRAMAAERSRVEQSAHSRAQRVAQSSADGSHILDCPSRCAPVISGSMNAWRSPWPSDSARSRASRVSRVEQSGAEWSRVAQSRANRADGSHTLEDDHSHGRCRASSGERRC